MLEPPRTSFNGASRNRVRERENAAHRVQVRVPAHVDHRFRRKPITDWRSASIGIGDRDGRNTQSRIDIVHAVVLTSQASADADERRSPVGASYLWQARSSVRVLEHRKISANAEGVHELFHLDEPAEDLDAATF